MAALLRTLLRPSVSVVTRSAVSDRMLVVKVDSTVELPSEPDPGSAGSSLAFGMSQHPSASAGHL